MADSAEGSSDPQVTFKVKTSGDSNHSITMAETATVLDLKKKLAGSEFEDIPVERQRLIYSGRVMKNEEPLSTYKIKPGNTVHLVKSAASNPTPAPASSSSSNSHSAAQQVPTNMAAGTANNPLAGLTGARYAGLTNLPSADMFGPDGGMSGSMMDEEQMANLLSNPMVAQQMNEMMNNDQFIDMMIQQNPLLRNNPNARDIIRSPMFRSMMTNPDALRSAARIQRMMRGGAGGANAFPAPGVTDNMPGANATTSEQQQQQPPSNPFDPMSWANLQIPTAQGQANAANPLAAMLNPFAMPQSDQTSAGTSSTGANTASNESNSNTASPGQGSGNSSGASSQPPPNPFASLFNVPNPSLGQVPPGMGAMGGMNPESLQQMMQILGLASPSGSPAPPADTRPPEERYAEQLRQLNDMGFYDFDKNVAALRRSGGSVQGAIEHLLNS